MMELDFLLNGNEVNYPQNAPELELELNFDRDTGEVKRSTNISAWDFVRENADFFLEWNEGGITGATPGVTEGVPFQIIVKDGSVQHNAYDGYIDQRNNPRLSKIRSTMTAKERDSIDWLNDRAPAVSFEKMYKIDGTITSADFDWMPYVLNSIPNYRDSAICIFAVHVIIQDIKEVVQKLSELAVEMANPFEATSILRTVLYILYIAALFVSLVILIRDIINMIIQPVKYHACMNLLTLFRKGAEAMGLEFVSPHFEDENLSKIYIMPEKFYVAENATDNRILGFTSPGDVDQHGYYKGTFAELLEAGKSIIRGKTIITADKKLYLVREDYNISTPTYQLPPIYQPYSSHNLNEFVKTYYIKFRVDEIEKNTIQQYEGTAFQVEAEQITTNNEEFARIGGITTVEIPFALAKKKTSLTVPEQIIDQFLDIVGPIIDGVINGINAIIDVANRVIGTLNNIIDALEFVGINVSWEIPSINNIPAPDLANLIDNRIGMMMIENDQFAVPKIFMMAKGSQAKFNKIHPLNDTILDAEYLWDNYHFIKSWVPTDERPNANQYKLYNFENVPFVFSNFEAVYKNNKQLTDDGKEAIITNLKWRPLSGKADIEFRVNELLTTNLREERMKPDGR